MANWRAPTAHCAILKFDACEVEICLPPARLDGKHHFIAGLEDWDFISAGEIPDDSNSDLLAEPTTSLLTGSPLSRNGYIGGVVSHLDSRTNNFLTHLSTQVITVVHLWCICNRRVNWHL